MFGSYNLLNTRENENLSSNTLSRITRHNTYIRMYNEAIYDVTYNQRALSASIERLKTIENRILNYLEHFNLNDIPVTPQRNNQSTENIRSSNNDPLPTETNSTESRTTPASHASSPLSTSYASAVSSRDTETMRNIFNSILNFDNIISNRENTSTTPSTNTSSTNTSSTNTSSTNTSSISSLFPLETSSSSPLIYFLLQRTSYDEDTESPRPIEEVITNCIYSDLISPMNTTCPIRLEPFEPLTEVSVINNCGHIFTRSYLNRWYETNQTCPMCRKPMLPESSSESTSSSSISSPSPPPPPPPSTPTTTPPPRPWNTFY